MEDLVEADESEEGEAEEETPLDEDGVFSELEIVSIVIGPPTSILDSLYSFTNRPESGMVLFDLRCGCTVDEPFAEIASFELELESTDRLSQKALSLSGLSIRFPLVLVVELPMTGPFVGEAALIDVF